MSCIECRHWQTVMVELLLEVQSRNCGIFFQPDLSDHKLPAQTQLRYQVISAANYTTTVMMYHYPNDLKARYGFAHSSYYVDHDLDQPQQSNYSCFFEMLDFQFEKSCRRRRDLLRIGCLQGQWAERWLGLFRQTHSEEDAIAVLKASALLHPWAAEAVQRFIEDPTCAHMAVRKR